MPGENIFISHASVNRPIADLFKNTLILGGVPRAAIFYSSTPSTGIPIGDNFRQYLRTKIGDSRLVLQLVSKEFVRRHWCLFEVGAAWALDSSTYPIVIPPMTRSDASTYLGETNTGILGSDDAVEDLFSELSDRIQQIFSYNLRVSDWNEAVRKFKADRAVAEVAAQGEAELPPPDPAETRTAAAIQRSADVNERTRQEEIAPFLDLIRQRQNKPEVYVRVPEKGAWLGFSTYAMRQFGMDSNSVHIYYSNPTNGTRPQLDTVARWDEEMSLGRLLEIVRRIFGDDPNRRDIADFQSGQIIDDFRSKLYELSGT